MWLETVCVLWFNAREKGTVARALRREGTEGVACSI